MGFAVYSLYFFSWFNLRLDNIFVNNNKKFNVTFLLLGFTYLETEKPLGGNISNRCIFYQNRCYYNEELEVTRSN